MGTPELSSDSRTGMPEVLSRSTGPQEVTAGGSRHVFDTLWQPSTINHQQLMYRISRLEASDHKLAERLALVEKEQDQGKVWSESVDLRLQFLESWHRQHAASDHYKPQQTSNPDPPYQEGHRRHEEAFPGGVSQKELQENEELKKLKEINKELETRFQQLLSKVMGMHEKSENINDPSHLSAVLKMYEMLRLHDWEKFWSSSSYLAYETGRSIIEKLFEACEKDIQQRTAKIFKVIGIPPLNDAMTNSKQGLMRAIRSVFRYSYYENDCEFYSKIVMEPPVEAVWNIDESSWQDLEHVDKTGRELWRKPVCLWPIMKCGEQVIVKGVVWESQVSTYSLTRSQKDETAAAQHAALLPPTNCLLFRASDSVSHPVEAPASSPTACGGPNALQDPQPRWYHQSPASTAGIHYSVSMLQVTDNMSWDPARKLPFRKPEYSEKMTVKDPYWKYYGIEQDAIMK